jgi:DNA ligase-1
MREQLEKLNKLVTALKKTNSTNKKKNILAKYPECKQFLFYTYNSLLQFGVTSTNLKKLENICATPIRYDNLFELLDDLSENKLTGHTAVATVNDFIHRHTKHKQLLYNIIDRNLKIRVKTSLINKVFPDLIPEFKVSLARDYKDFEHKINFNKDRWFASRKLDGVRCITIKDGSNITFFSRTGKPFHTLSKVAKAVRQLPIEQCVFDGEMCIINNQDEEDFTAIVSEIRRKSHVIKHPMYKLFDILTIDEFKAGYSDTLFSYRYEKLVNLIEALDIGSTLSVLPQTVVTDDNFNDLREFAIENKWEGLILRKDTPYEGKRSNDMLKLKQFIDEEFVVKRIETGPMRHIIDKGYGVTLEVEDTMMTKAFIEYKGFEVPVGSGWTIQQRIDFCNNPDLIVLKTITVQHFGETHNNDGGISLRFPTLKCIYDADKDI